MKQFIQPQKINLCVFGVLIILFCTTNAISGNFMSYQDIENPDTYSYKHFEINGNNYLNVILYNYFEDTSSCLL
ncbi:secreted protein [Candidatus Magnetomorum sp. HK-1]|nr:secreted protein [Candidatus Magnetomorum sp. HK-1]